MLKRLYYKQDHGDRDDDGNSDSSSSSSSSDSEAEEPQYDEEVDIEAVSEPKQQEVDEEQPSSGSGYESGDSSGNDVDYDPSGLLINDNEEGSGRQDLSYSHSTGRGNAEGGEAQATIPAKKDSTQDDFADCILKCKSVFKCRLCPRIVCLTQESLRAHLESKRHRRSEKLLSEGRLKLMLNSDGEIEEDQETHAERHARTVAIAKDLTNQKKKSSGRQRQRRRLRLKRQKKAGCSIDENPKQLTKKSAKKRKRRDED